MSDKGPSGQWRGTTGDLTDGGEHRMVNGFSTKLNPDKQAKHIPGHRYYEKGRSIFLGSLADAQELIDRLAGTGISAGHQRERVDCGKVIGIYVNARTGERSLTTMGTIRYSKTGSHIVPAHPKEE